MKLTRRRRLAWLLQDARHEWLTWLAVLIPIAVGLWALILGVCYEAR